MFSNTVTLLDLGAYWIVLVTSDADLTQGLRIWTEQRGSPRYLRTHEEREEKERILGLILVAESLCYS